MTKEWVFSGVIPMAPSRPLLQVAIATFTNPAGLIGIGNSLYSLSNNSGDPQVNPPGMIARLVQWHLARWKCLM